MLKTFKKSPIAFSVMLAILFSLLLSTNQAQAQTIPTEVNEVCNYLNKANHYLKYGNKESDVYEAINALLQLEKYRESKTPLNAASKDKLTEAMFDITKTAEPSITQEFKQELREDMEYQETLGEIVKPFYDAMVAQFK